MVPSIILAPDSSRLRIRLSLDGTSPSNTRLLISREEIILPLTEDDNRELFGWNADLFLEKLSNISILVKFISEHIFVHPHLKAIFVYIISTARHVAGNKSSHSFLDAMRRYILHDTVPMSPSQMASLQPGGHLWKAVQKAEDELLQSFDLNKCEVPLGAGFLTSSLQLIRNRYSVLLGSEMRYKSLYLMNHPDNRLVSWEPPGKDDVVSLPETYWKMLMDHAVARDLAQDALSFRGDYPDGEGGGVDDSLEYAIANLLFDGKKFHLRVRLLLKFLMFVIAFANKLPEALQFDVEKILFDIFDSYLKNFSSVTGYRCIHK